MSEIIIYVDTSEILDGKIGDLEKAVAGLVKFVDEHESRPIAYSFYFNQEKTRMTLIQVHPDSASLELHMQIAASNFPQFTEYIKFLKIDVYGKPSESLLTLLKKKTQMLGSGVVELHELQSGFIRLDTARHNRKKNPG